MKNVIAISLRCLVFVFTVIVVDGCFDQLDVLSTSRMWTQTSGSSSYVKMEAGLDSNASVVQIYKIKEGSPRKLKSTMTCLKMYPANTVLVRVDSSSPGVSHKFQCVRFDVISDLVLRLFKSEFKASSDGLNCADVDYIQDGAVITSADEKRQSGEPCPLQKSYYINGSFFLPGKIAKPVQCQATVRFLPDSNQALFTFVKRCRHIFPFSVPNKSNYLFSHHFRCFGKQSRNDGNTVMVLRHNEAPFNSWCLRYKTSDEEKEELEVSFVFDGSCDFGSGVDASSNILLSEGKLASFTPCHDEHCAKERCKHCYNVPTQGDCNFNPSFIGQWKSRRYTGKELTVDIGHTGVASSAQGKFACLSSESTHARRVSSTLVSYDENKDFAPLYVCMRASPSTLKSPGIMIFSLRQTSIVDGSVEPKDCKSTRRAFEKYPTEDGETITLFKEDLLRKETCNFPIKSIYSTSIRNCKFSIDKLCSDTCDTVRIRYENETCGGQSLTLPKIAENHTCFAFIKARDGVYGHVIYSNLTRKMSCWIFTSVSFYIAEPSMCNYEAIVKIVDHQDASKVYDPLLTLSNLSPLQLSPSGGNSFTIRALYGHLTMSIVSILLVNLMVKN